jgi:predicted transglutaminase-like cysteine proteinase
LIKIAINAVKTASVVFVLAAMQGQASAAPEIYAKIGLSALLVTGQPAAVRPGPARADILLAAVDQALVQPRRAARNFPDGAISAPAPVSVARPAALNLGVFNSVTISAARLPMLSNWQAATKRDYSAYFTPGCTDAGFANCGKPFARKLQAVAAELDGSSGLDMIGRVNRAVNAALAYKSDASNWGTGDHWATPAEMGGRGAGDCEDFAIAKYWMLRSLGVSADQLQLVVLSDTRRQLYHAVLAAYVDGQAYILDNLSSAVSRDTAYQNYMPIMSFTASHSYIHGFKSRTTGFAANLGAVHPGEGI